MGKVVSEQVEYLIEQMKKLTAEGLRVEECYYYSKIFKDVQEVVLGLEKSVQYDTILSRDDWKIPGVNEYDENKPNVALRQVVCMDSRNMEKIEVLNDFKRIIKKFVDTMTEDINGYEVTFRRESKPLFSRKPSAYSSQERLDADEAIVNLRDILRFKEELIVSPFYIEKEEKKKKEAEMGEEE